MPRLEYPRTASIDGVLRRLTPRDFELIRLLGRHSMFTLEQITALLFTSDRSARRRLEVLRAMDVVARFRTCVRPGSQAYRYTLGHRGAYLYAAAEGLQSPRRPAWERRMAELATSSRSEHLLGVNGFFARLTAACRRDGTLELAEWLSESETAKLTGGLVRPDASGILHGTAGAVEVWFEYDTGTETTERVALKLDRYQEHLSGWPRTVLFELPSAAREEHLHSAWRTVGQRFPVATTVAGRAADPTAQVWRVPNQPVLWRLDELP
ncbi:Replication-relaxation [Glycomyces sambucus]|uniref:Replication-relaxation n=1 Tax=Glycomyces sambucus TaxID=380244 RepID=A0A1G9LVE9_9ACTN|nr:replication-relaxation family protein [Glycomyces sambucus]SDL65926.1 Replication-relaxation [Glycomyces sambucus]